MSVTEQEDPALAAVCAQAEAASKRTTVQVHVMRRPSGKLEVFDGNPHLFSGARVATYARGYEVTWNARRRF